MQKLFVIGNLGSDAEVRTRDDGSKFVTFKVADTTKWVDLKQQTHESTTWISCVLNGDGGNLLQYLKRGVKVFVDGRPSYRVYSSEKERAVKAGVDLSVMSIELCGGNSDAVPSQLVDANGLIIPVTKCYWCEGHDNHYLYGVKGGMYAVNSNGFINPIAEQPTEEQSTEDKPIENKKKK